MAKQPLKNELKVTFEEKFVKVISNGEKNFAFSTRLWTEVSACCVANNCFKVLGIANTTTPLRTIEAFNHAQLFIDLDIDSRYRIAWVELNPEGRDTVNFIETVLFNRGLPGRIFSTASEAIAWLLEEGSQ